MAKKDRHQSVSEGDVNANQLALLNQLQHFIISSLFMGSEQHNGISSDGKQGTVKRTGDANIHDCENQNTSTD